MKPQPERFNAFGKTSPGEGQATGRKDAFVKIGHGRCGRHHDQGGARTQVAKVVDRDVPHPQPVRPSASQSVNPEQPVIRSALQSVSPDNVHLLTGLPRSGPRSESCQTPIGNVITHNHSAARGPSLRSDDAQSPPLSVPTEAIEFAKMFPELLGEIDDLTRPQILFKIKEAMRQMKKAKEHNH